MALKPDRYTLEQDISFFCNDATNRGVLLCYAPLFGPSGYYPPGTLGSGVALDQTQAVAVLPGTGAVSVMKPIGVLMNDMVSIDLTKFHLNFYKDVMPVGGKCCILKKGWVITDQISSGFGTLVAGGTTSGGSVPTNPQPGDNAYLSTFGQFTNSSSGNGSPATLNVAPKVGTFLSAKDEKGFCKIEINIP